MIESKKKEKPALEQPQQEGSQSPDQHVYETEAYKIIVRKAKPSLCGGESYASPPLTMFYQLKYRWLDPRHSFPKDPWIPKHLLPSSKDKREENLPSAPSSDAAMFPKPKNAVHPLEVEVAEQNQSDAMNTLHKAPMTKPG